MKSQGVAVWGLGRHARNRILPAISEVEALTLVGVCSRSQETVEACSQQWNCIGWTDPEGMLKHPDVQTVIVSTPIGLHIDHGIRVLTAGKHLWCEKPLTCSYEDTQELIRLSEERDLMVTESFMHLYHPQFSRVEQFIRAKEAGQVRSVICQFGIPTLENPGFRNDPNLCGGALWDAGSYTVSAVLELFAGQQEQVLFAEIDQQSDSSVDHGGRALIRFSKGGTAFLEWGTGLGYRNEINVWSEQGALYTDKIFSKPAEFEPVYKVRDQSGVESLEQGPIVEQFVEMFKFFADMYDNPQNWTRQRERTLNVAKIMDDIVKISGKA